METLTSNWIFTIFISVFKIPKMFRDCCFSKFLNFPIQNGALNLLNVSCPFVILCQTVRPFFSRGPVAAETASRRSCWWLRLSWSTASSLRRRWQSGKSNCIGTQLGFWSFEIWPLFHISVGDPFGRDLVLGTRRTFRRRYEDDHDGGRDPRPHQDGRQRRHQKEWR